MIEIFEKHHGKWSLFTHLAENNIRAKTFWYKTIGGYTENQYATEEKIIDEMLKLVFRFDN